VRIGGGTPQGHERRGRAPRPLAPRGSLWVVVACLGLVAIVGISPTGTGAYPLPALSAIGTHPGAPWEPPTGRPAGPQHPLGFSSPVVISSGSNPNGGPGNAPSSAPSVADDSSGRIDVAYASNVSGKWEIFFTQGTSGGASFSTPVAVSGAPTSGYEYVSPSISVNSGATEICITFLRTAISNINLGVGDYEESCSSNSGSTWSALQTDNGKSANVCSWGTLYDPVGAFDAAGNYLVNYLCKLYSNSSLALGWDEFSSSNTWQSSVGFPLASYTHYTVTLAFACGSSGAGCATAYTLTDGSNTDWHLLVVSSTSDFSAGSIVGPVPVASVPVPAGNLVGLEVFSGGLSFASSGSRAALVFLTLASGSTTSFDVALANTTNAWASGSGVTVSPAPPGGTFGSGFDTPSVAVEGATADPFVVWDNSSATNVFATAATNPGVGWASRATLPTSGGSPSVAVTGGGAIPWREDLVFIGSAAPQSVEYVSLAGPALGGVVSDHPGGELGLDVNFTATGASGGYPGYTYLWSAAPPTGLGCALGSAIRVTCTPTVGGTYDLTVQAQDSAGFLSPVVSLTAFPVVTAVAAAAPVGWPHANVGDLGQSIYLNSSITGGAAPYTDSWSGLPGGCGAATTASVACTLAPPTGATSVVVAANDAYNYNSTSPALVYTVYSGPSVSGLTGTPNPAMANTSVAFSATVSGGAPGYSYAWTFAGAGTSTLAAPSATFTTGGGHGVWLNVTDGAGVVAGSSMTESVDRALGVTVTATPGTPVVGQTVWLNATITGGTSPFVCSWNFGDGTRGSGTSVSHAYGAAGSYTAKAFVNDSLGFMATASVSATVSPGVAPLTIAPSAVPDPTNTTTPVAFSANVAGGTSPYTILWHFGDASAPASGAAVNHLYSVPSSGNGYQVNVTVTDASGRFAHASLNVTVNTAAVGNPLLVGPLTASPDPGAASASVAFSVAVQGGTLPYSYAWQFGDGGTSSGSVPSASHVYAGAGDYDANVTVTDGAGHSGRATLQEIVQPPGSLTLTLVASVSAPEAGVAVNFTAHAGGGTGTYETFTFAWGDGTVNSVVDTHGGGAASSLHVFPLSGSFTVTATVADSSGSQISTSQTVRVVASPTVTLRASELTTDAGLPVVVNAFVSGGSGAYVGFSWTVNGGGSYPSSAELSTSFPTSGDETVAITVTDSSGGTGSAQLTITVDPRPHVTLEVTPTGGTAPLASTLQATVSGGVGPYQYTVSFGDGSAPQESSTGTFEHNFTSAGTFAVTVTATDALGVTSTAYANVTVTSASPGPAGILSNLLGATWFWLLLVLLVVAVVAVALARRRRSTPRGEEVYLAAGEADLLAPPASPLPGDVSDATAEDGIPSREPPPKHLPMLNPPPPDAAAGGSAADIAAAGAAAASTRPAVVRKPSRTEVPPAASQEAVPPPPEAREIPHAPMPAAEASSASVPPVAPVAPLPSTIATSAAVSTLSVAAGSSDSRLPEAEQKPKIQNCLQCGSRLPPDMRCTSCGAYWGPSSSPSAPTTGSTPAQTSAPGPRTVDRKCFICGNSLQSGYCATCGVAWEEP
jgi:PKD repeat protein